MSIEFEDSSQHSSGSNDDGDDASSLEDSAPTKSAKGKQPAVASTNVKAKMKKPMTARQAVLASVGGGVSSHITLCELLLSLLSFCLYLRRLFRVEIEDAPAMGWGWKWPEE